MTPALDDLVNRLLAKSPDERPAMAELPTLLETALACSWGVVEAASELRALAMDTIDAPLASARAEARPRDRIGECEPSLDAGGPFDRS